MAYTHVWSNAAPADTQLAKLLGQDLRDLKVDIQERLGTFLSGLLASRPTPEASWAGILYFATDTGQIFRWNGASWNLFSVSDSFRNAVPVATVTPVGDVDGVSVNVPANVMADGDVWEVSAGVRCVQVPAPATPIVALHIPGAPGVLAGAPVAANGNQVLFRWMLSMQAGFGVNVYTATFTNAGVFDLHPASSTVIDFTIVNTFKTEISGGNGTGSFVHEFICVKKL